ncbi:2-oxoglutarate dehydrogenase complex dihydrolipoyllysine-residue succinyltransferase [Alkalitalea saponilacus]|uniref:Dihydrolipoyllysine-residue succinyltransferase n=1 Tax=Alkalitalea saponilacus TaxID=889453 RepID=A0A1T5HRU2_9BACT|nr:2-oxoglutarate dehydrogenase complex dihydrolipoyllysine-residue succinyltransferase [Alkalitalea saponilacus]ASB50067.1 dihydrolipoamide succinyltransferase [Alkalitalea saponilacus]SKC23413.1 2-oxoglutarate dehydrogenase E2 component [Alkalitalea saponilacus]
MITEVKVPTPGESISEVELSSWLVSDGDLVRKNQDLAEIESDKATLSLTAPESGKIELLASEGDVVKVNSVVCKIDTSVEVPEEINGDEDEAEENLKAEEKEKAPVADESGQTVSTNESQPDSDVKLTPLARKKMEAEGLNLNDVLAGLKKLTTKEIDKVIDLQDADGQLISSGGEVSRDVERKRMTQLRKQLSKRLVQVKNETAMLTTFNEVDMSALMDLRKKHQGAFVEKYGFKIGLISFFLKASAYALKMHPMVNSMIDEEEIVTPNYVDISVAVQSPKGLMVPVIRNVDSLSLAQIESALKELAEKARTGKVSLEEMTGGTFTLTNGGVFGSMLSTPLINPPQSAIIGMHNIVERPVAVNGKVEIRPMMYVALSYDHRIIDGKDSVGFLVDVKKMIENPLSMLLGGKSAEEALLGL